MESNVEEKVQSIEKLLEDKNAKNQHNETEIDNLKNQILDLKNSQFNEIALVNDE